MTDVPSELRYTESHEWLRQEEEDVVTIGVSDKAQELLGDLVYVELPEVGEMIGQGGEAAVVESVKAASDVYAPVSGEVVEVNRALLDAPDLVNSEPYEGGWLFKLQISEKAELENLLSAENYQKVVNDDA